MQLPELARDVLLITEGRDDLLVEAETQVLGFTHAEVGGALAESWGLPDSICHAIRYHHDPMKSTKYLMETCTIHISHVLAAGMHKGGGGDLDEVLGYINPEALAFLKLTHEDCILALNYVADEVREMYNSLIGYGAVSGQAD